MNYQLIIIGLLLLSCGKEDGSRGCLGQSCWPTIPAEDLSVDPDLEEASPPSSGNVTVIIVPPAPPVPVVVTLPPAEEYVCVQKVAHSSKCFKKKENR